MGIDNFRFTRNRILWHLRDDAPILGNPKSVNEVHTIGKKEASTTNKTQLINDIRHNKKLLILDSMLT